MRLKPTLAKNCYKIPTKTKNILPWPYIVGLRIGHILTTLLVVLRPHKILSVKSCVLFAIGIYQLLTSTNVKRAKRLHERPIGFLWLLCKSQILVKYVCLFACLLFLPWDRQFSFAWLQDHNVGLLESSHSPSARKRSWACISYLVTGNRKYPELQTCASIP